MELLPFRSPFHAYSRLIRSDASRRNAFGELLELAVAEALGGQRLGINTDHTICPDLIVSGLYVEVKASKEKRWVIYPFRVERERAFTGDTPYLYALAAYRDTRPRVGSILTHEELKSLHVYLVALEEIEQQCEWLQVKKPKSVPEGLSVDGEKAHNRLYAGYYRPGYVDGWVELRDVPPSIVVRRTQVEQTPVTISWSLAAFAILANRA